MADIFLAHSTNEAGVERYVVLKRVLAERSRDPQLVAMLLDEARLAAQLQHPSIAQVHDIGKLGGSFFYTMEYVHGEDLRAILHRLSTLHRPFPINLALYIATSALSGLHHAHTRRSSEGRPLGIVHRDVSPSNLMVSYEGAIKLLDFGVAKASERTAESSAGTVKGKIAYCSPEQCRGEVVDPRSDIYSLGIVLHEMLTCKRLYKRDSDFNTMMAIVMQEVAPPSQHRPELPPDVDRIVMTALAKDPGQRYANAADMLDAIEEVAAREHHVLSASAMGRFMRELFGERPEPWLKLPAADDAPRSITVTSESVIGVGALPSATRAGAPVDETELEADDALEAQLEQAPTLWTADGSGSSGASAQALAPEAIVPPPSHAAPSPIPEAPTPARAPMAPAAPVLPASPQATPLTPFPVAPLATPLTPFPVAPAPAPFPILPAPTEPASPLRLKRLFVIAAVAVAIIGVVLVILPRHGSGDSASRPDASSGGVATSATAEPSAEDAGSAVVRPSVLADAAVTASASSPPLADAAVTASASSPPLADAAVTASAAPPQIAEAVAKADWAGALQICAGLRPGNLPADDRMGCGIAACNAGQRKAAASYYQIATKPGQLAIERACRTQNIALAPAPQVPVRPKDPCDDKQFRVQNPLQCQK